MEDKVISFDNSLARIKKLGTSRAENGDYIGGLGFFYQALQGELTNDEVLSLYMDIADCYADMELYELSNKFWFAYLDKAPKDKMTLAYEELGINFFYMNNLWMSGYYFHKKFTEDGFISPEGLDQDIVDFFSNELDKRDEYRIVYPFEHADYKKELTEAKRAIAASDFTTAELYLKKIPPLSPQGKEALSELSMLNFIKGDSDLAIEYCRKNIEENGESLTTYCNLSSIYHYKKDRDKSAYYFEKAMEYPIDDITDVYKIATCALEQGKHLYAMPYLERILSERPYDYNISYLYGLALINCGAMEKAITQLSKTLSMNPDDGVVKYYIALARRLEREGDRENILPLKYIADVPEKEAARRKQLICSIAAMTVIKINQAIKKKEIMETLLWGIRCGDEAIAKASIVALASSTVKYAEKTLCELLIDNDLPLFIKEMILYCLVVSGCKRNLSLVKVNCFMKAKPRKLRFESSATDQIFFISYAFCFSRLAFTSVSNLDKVAFAIESVYKKLKDIDLSFVKKEDLAALVAYRAGYKEFKKKESVVKLFSADEKVFDRLVRIMEGKYD
ncbi:MAG: tetratricopeptide repeat protein [Clostridiales bacterium]|nr:tetratricopeptide repeat protein [Clostridiales bacterium]